MVVVFVFSVVLVGSECSVAFGGAITTRRGVDEEAGGSLSSLHRNSSNSNINRSDRVSTTTWWHK